jgi:hypothetical protein
MALVPTLVMRKRSSDCQPCQIRAGQEYSVDSLLRCIIGSLGLPIWCNKFDVSNRDRGVSLYCSILVHRPLTMLRPLRDPFNLLPLQSWSKSDGSSMLPDIHSPISSTKHASIVCNYTIREFDFICVVHPGGLYHVAQTKKHCAHMSSNIQRQ